MDDVIMIDEDGDKAVQKPADDSIINLDDDDVQISSGPEEKKSSVEPKKDLLEELFVKENIEKVKVPFDDVDDLNKFLDDQFKKLDIDSMIDKALDSLTAKIRKQERSKYVINRILSDSEDALSRTEKEVEMLRSAESEINIPSGSDSDDDIQIVAASGVASTAVARKRTTPVKATQPAVTPQPIVPSNQPQYKLIVNNSTGQAVLQPIGGASMLSRQEMVSILNQTNLMNQVKHLQQAAPAPDSSQAPPQHIHQRKQQFPPTASGSSIQQQIAKNQLQQIQQNLNHMPNQAQRPALQYNQLQHKQIELAVGMKLYGKKNNEIWYKGTLLDIYEKGPEQQKIKLKFDGKGMKVLDGKTVALGYPPANILPVGSRIIALYKEEGGPPSFYAGIAAESPSFRNMNRYLIFFDDGYAQYCDPNEVRKVVEQSRNVWDDVHPDSKEFIRKYLHQYPERPMVKLQRGQKVKTEWNGIWWAAFVEQVDASLVKMYFDADKRTEWIYRGSTRLEPLYTELANAEVSKQGGKARRHHGNLTKSTKAPYVEYLRNYEDDVQIIDGPGTNISPQRNVKIFQANSSQFGATPDPTLKKAPTARKSSASAQNTVQSQMQLQHQQQHQSRQQKKNVQGHVQGRDMVSILNERLGTVGKNEESFGSLIEVTRKNLPPLGHHMRYKQHACGKKCLKDVVDDPAKFKGNNPLLIPMLCGWERQISKQGNTGRRIIFYRTPCGRRLRNIEETDRYLMATDSQLTIDLFCYDQQLSTHSEFVPIKTFCDIKDLSYGKEAVPISCVNGIDRQYPDYVQYSNQRMPGKGVHLNTDPAFLCGCDCTDGCRDITKCRCLQMTLQAKRAAAGMSHRADSDTGYKYRRLVDQLITGIYECNPQCGCDARCHNRVAQNSLALRLQVFKTEKRGWGLRCLDDIPAGGFICIYAGQLLTEQGANEDGQQYGDEYLAELDYIEVVEKMKEGYESDVEDPEKEESEEEKKEVEEEEERPRDSDSDSNFSLHRAEGGGGGRRRRRRAVKARPMTSQQKTVQWIHNLPSHHGATTSYPGMQQPTVRSILAQAGLQQQPRQFAQFSPPKKVSQDAIVISDEDDVAQIDGQYDDEMVCEETPHITDCYSSDAMNEYLSDSEKAFDNGVTIDNDNIEMVIDYAEAFDSVQTVSRSMSDSDSDSVSSWRIEQYDGPSDHKARGRKSRTISVELCSEAADEMSDVRDIVQIKLPQFDGPPDEEEKEGEKEEAKEEEKGEKKKEDEKEGAEAGKSDQEKVESKEEIKSDHDESMEHEVKEDEFEMEITPDPEVKPEVKQDEKEAPKSENEEPCDDLETDLPDECLLNTAEGDDFFTDEKSQDSDEAQGIANLTITEPTSLNIDQIIADLEDDEEDDESMRYKRTTRSQTSRFQNLPNPEEAAKQTMEKLTENKKKAEKPGTTLARSYREMCGEESCYIMDAKSMGNLGRYLNHSCGPNVFVQNVFVDTHDLRFPWVAFFAAQYIRAGTELTWDYNYDVGSVPGKVLYCYCGASECRGRLL